VGCEGSNPSVAIVRKLDMINAKAANALSKKGSADKLRKLVEDEIVEAVEKGAFSCRIDHQSLEDNNIRQEIMGELRKLGYTLRYDSGSSCRESYSHLYIEWKLS
jgi:hypothetical protein